MFGKISAMRRRMKKGSESQELEQDSGDQEVELNSEEEEQTQPLQLNVTSIPGFDMPYVPSPMPKSEDGTDSSDEETVVAVEEKPSDKVLELFSIFNADELVVAVTEDH